MAVLAAAAGLADVLGLVLDGLANGLPVGHLRLADIGLDAEFASHAVHEHVEMQLTHARDDGLPGLFVGLHRERRILLGELAKSDGHLLLVGDRLGLDRHRDHRIREVHALECDHRIVVAERVAGRGFLQADGGRDIAGAHFLDLVAGVRVHLHHAPDSFPALTHRVEDLIAGTEHPRVHAEERERAHVRIGGDLERQCGERFRIVGVALRMGHAVVEHALDGLDLGRCGQVVDDRIEHRLNTLVLERRAAQRRNDLVGQSPHADAFANLRLG